MLIDVSETVRIESGPARKRAKASADLLDNKVTASHYLPPRPATKAEIADPSALTEGKQFFYRDAMGKPIKLGETMDYIDWLAPDDEHVWTVYQADSDSLIIETDDDGNKIELPRFMPISVHATRAEAETAAAALDEGESRK